MDSRIPELGALDAKPGPAKRIGAAREAAMVDAVMGAAFAGPVAQPRGILRFAKAAAVLALLAGAGTAAAVYFGRQPAEQRRSAPAPAPPAVPPGAAEAPAQSVKAEPVVEEPQAVAQTSRPPAKVAPEDLLQTANSLRGERKWPEAERTYARVLREFPGSSQAYAATLASAGLRLDHLGDPAGALRLYRAALRSRGTGALAEEARWGIVEANQSLGDRAAEVEALQTFLARHPQSFHRSSAEARLTELTQ